MVDNGTPTRRTGFSSFESAESNQETRTTRRAETLNLDLERNTRESDGYEQHGRPVRKFWKLHMRPADDDLPQDWWFASTAIPLLAATIGPLANVLSIAALVTQWRVTLPNNGQLPLGKDENGVGIPDPHWEIVLNAISLACGAAGNIALLLNFTRRIRYIIALPLSIIFWYIATGILVGITVAMNEFDAPVRPGETYSQGFWYAIMASALYMSSSMILMINMMGYFLGHYPQHFELDDDQRTLILQTMMFFIWLAGGAGVFSSVCGFSYADALYFCDVTVLTVGFGDIVANNDVGRGLIFPYSVGGIIFLGLVINSIRNFAISMGKENIVKSHQQRMRERTINRTVTSEKELREKLGLPPRRSSEIRRAPIVWDQDSARPENQPRGNSLSEFGTFERHGLVITFQEKAVGHGRRTQTAPSRAIKRPTTRREKLLMLKEEKDRFDAMRRIQQKTKKFKQYYALSMSALSFGLLWCLGALIFMYAERRQQDLSYFKALYFCYVSLLTIGYGDLAPQSNAGKPFFVVWSLLAVPTMTILINDMSDTIIASIKRGTFTLGDWTVLPRVGVWHDFLVRNPRLLDWLQRKHREREASKRIERGFELNDPDDDVNDENGGGNPLGTSAHPLTLEKLARDKPEETEHDFARKLSLAIKRVANDLKRDSSIKYGYEEWAEFTRLIRFSSRMGGEEVEEMEDEKGLVEWDWIGEDSPMLADEGEAKWVLDRLCESLDRYCRRLGRRDHFDKERQHHRKRRRSSDHSGRVSGEWSRHPETMAEDTPEGEGRHPEHGSSSSQGSSEPSGSASAFTPPTLPNSPQVQNPNQ